MAPPNLFSFATSELSQDAFICWLVAWANVPDHPLGNVGRAFIRLLYKVGTGKSVNLAEPVEVTYGPVRQYLQTDVYFQARVGDRVVSVIIEDKIDGSPNPKRLKQRRDDIRRDRPDGEPFACIYFKTGFIFPEDHRVIEQGYGILDSKRLHGFLVEHILGTNSEIYRAYVEHLHTGYVRPQRDDYPALLAGTVNRLRYARVQWQFMTDLRDQLLSSHAGQQVPPFEVKGVRRGNSRGRPWTQIDVGNVSGVLDGMNESLAPSRGSPADFFAP